MKSIKTYIYIAISIIFINSLIFCEENNAGKITLKIDKINIVNNEDVLLGDIASITNADDNTLKALSSIELEKSPLAGKSNLLKKEILLAKLDNKGFNSSEINLISPETISIERASKNLDIEILKERIKEEVIAQLPYDPERIIVSNFRLPENILIPNNSNINYEINIRSKRKLTGITQFNVSIKDNDKEIKNLIGTVEVDVKIDIIKANTSITRNQLITENMLEVSEARLSQLGRGYVENTEDVIGNIAKRNIERGNIITANMLAKEMLIQRNSTVMIIAERGTMRVTAMGKALQNGSKGEIISIVNVTSNKTVFAEVIDKNTVKVYF